MLRVASEADVLAREDLAFALSVVLLGMLMMVVRRNAVSMVVGFMSLENGPHPRRRRRQGHAPGGRGFGRLFGAGGAGGDRRLPLPHRRTIRDGRRARARSVSRGPAMTGWPNAALVILALPAATAALLAALPSYRLSGGAQRRLRLRHVPRVGLAAVVAPPPNAYLLVDDLNVVFIVLNTFVGFTASVFSATYIAHEIETGRLTPTHLRFYHAMYQFLLFSMNLALIANNIGLMWVAIELATLTTVLMVGIYRHAGGDRSGVEILHPRQRRHRARAVRHDPGLHGRRPVVGEGVQAMLWTSLIRPCAAVRPGAARPRFRLSAARLRHQGRPCAAARLAAGRARRRADADFRRPVRASCSTSRSTPCFASSCCSTPTAHALAPGPLMVTLGLVSVVVRRLHALSPSRREAHVRLFVDRAHGRSSSSRSASAVRSPTSPRSCTWRCTA